MKKLIAMIGAVALAFGLYADDPVVYDGTSFEAGEAGVEGSAWSPEGDWTAWTDADPFELGAYAGDEYKYASDKPRRDGSAPDIESNVFPKENINDNYLKLSTGTNTLTRAVANKNYFDQVVKFTGFEEAQTNFVDGTKIAIWTSAIESNGDVAGDTNLYVAVGTGALAEPIKNVKINVGGDFDFTAWHRVTIQNVGAVSGTYAGFLVWIDGVMADTDDDYFVGQLSAYQSYYKEGQLFIAMDDSTAVSGVGFAGQGCIDDVAVTSVGPKFTDLTIDVTVTPIEGAIITVTVKDATGKEITIYPDPVSGKYAIPAGDFTVTYTAAQGYKLAGDPVEKKHDTTETPVDDRDTVKPAVVVATKNGTLLYAEDELYGMINGLVDDDQVAFVKQCNVTNIVDGESVTLYSAYSNTTIDVDQVDDILRWSIKVGNYIEGEDVFAGTFIDNVGVEAGKAKLFDADSEDALVMFAGDVAGIVTVDTAMLQVTAAITVSGSISAENLTIDDTITLSGEGKVETKVEDDLTDFFNSEEGDVVRTGPQDGWYTYQIDAAEPVAKIGDGRTFTTLAAAFAEAAATDTVTLLDNVVLDEEIAFYDKTITLTGAYTVSTAVGKAFNVRHGATLTIDVGTTVTASGTDTTIFVWPYVEKTATAGDSAKATLIVNGTVTYTGSNSMAAITTSGNDSLADSEGVEIVINGTVSNTKDAALYLPGKGVYTVNAGAAISGVWAGIQMKSGALTVNGGTISCTGADSTPTTPYNNGANKSGCAIQLEGNGSYWGNMTLTVNGGTISAEYGKAIYGYGDATKLGAITLNGGTFTCGNKDMLFQFDTDRTIIPGTSNAQFDRDVSKFCVADFKTVKLEGADYFTVVPREYVAQVGTDKFETVAEALAKVQELEAAGTYPINVTALDDVTIPGTVVGDSLTLAEKGTIAIMPNSWTITGTVSGKVTLAYGKTLVVPAGSEVTVSPTSSEDYEIKKSTADNKDTYTVAEVAKEITITLTKGTGIAKILVDGVEKDGGITLPKDTTTVKIELVAVDTIKIPVYKNGDTVIGKVTTAFAVADKESYTFKAEEASEEEVTEDQAKQALKDAGMSDEKLEAAKTAGGVTAKQIAAWAKDNGGATALAGDYVGASVALGVAPISTGTPVKIETLTKGEGTVLTFKVKVGDDDVSGKAAITSMVKATDDLTKKAWELAAGVAIEDATVKVTPPPGKTQAFVKVVIPADVPAAE